ncbi:MAG TPA: aspartate/glutamate racemase family protein [Candidatus Acidoferrum sp.]|nr:aspartate/glutamate racemase family protein [Candidatus Acidoferrum sp.]
MPTIALVHAVLPALAPMERAILDEIPGARVRHLFDEGLSTEAERYGGVTTECVERMMTVLDLAIRARADAVLLTCTAYSTMVPQARERFPGTPIYAVDQMMVERAVADATRIGVLATFPAGLEQQRVMLEAEAAARGKAIEIVPSLHPEAMTALRAGDAAAHDRIVLDALPEIADRSDLVLLAQVSMARVYPQVPDRYADRVLSSPQLAARALKATLV